MQFTHRAWRAWVAVGMTGVLAGALAACGSSAPTAQATKTQTKLVVWSFQGSSPNPKAGVPYAFYLINKKFMQQNPNIKVDMVLQPFGNYRPLFATAATAHSGPDVWESLPGEWVWQYKNALVPLNSYVTSSLRTSLKGWSGAIVPEWHHHGTIWAVPSEIQSLVWYYNKALFAKAGLNPNQPPTTWNQMVHDAQVLKKAGIVPIAAGMKDGFWADNLLSSMYPTMFAGLQSYGLTDGKVSWTSAKMEQMLTLMKNLAPYYEPGFQGVDLFPDGVNLFAAGKAAMYIGIISNNQNYFQFQQSLGVKKLGVFQAPQIAAGIPPQMAYTSDYMWTITKWAPNKKAAFKYVKFMVSPYAQKILLKDGGDIPNLTNVSASEFASNPATKTIWHLLQTSTFVGWANTAFSTQLETEWHQQVQDMYAGTETPQQVAQNMATYMKSQ